MVSRSPLSRSSEWATVIRKTDLYPGPPTLGVLPVTAFGSWICCPTLDPGGPSSCSSDPIFLPQSQQTNKQQKIHLHGACGGLRLALPMRFNAPASPGWGTEAGGRTWHCERGAGTCSQTRALAPASLLSYHQSKCQAALRDCGADTGSRHLGQELFQKLQIRAPTWASYLRAFLPGDSLPHGPSLAGGLRGVSLAFQIPRRGGHLCRGGQCWSPGPQACCRTPFIKKPF